MKKSTKIYSITLILLLLMSSMVFSYEIKDDATATEEIKVEESAAQFINIQADQIKTVGNKNPIEYADAVVMDMPPISSDGYVMYYKYNSLLPDFIAIDLEYDKYLTASDYIFVEIGSVNIREGPGTYHPVIRVSTQYEKISVLEAVQGEFIKEYGGDMWYKVAWGDESDIQYGYILASIVDFRRYEFSKMLESINRLEAELANYKMGFVSNYKNWNGSPPFYKGLSEDIYGNVRYQSTPAYYSLEDHSEFIYLSDGTLLSILEENEKYYRVKTLIYEGEFWVPKRYVNFNDGIAPLTQMVVIDRNNQNQAVFEKREGSWTLVSYTLATTGADTKFKYPTPLGYFMAIEKKPKFLYLDDYTQQISGYAPYTVRFTGGAYIHGVPIEYKKQGGKLVDPGHREFSPTIGTIPRSHKCVRNYTSHAKFLYDWAKIGEMAVIVIE